MDARTPQRGARSAVELPATWRARVADDETRRIYQDLGYDDSAWDTVTVPGHWQRHEAFADTDGPVLHRVAFHHEHTPGTRAWLTFDGAFYQTDVWLDGGYLGDGEGYFFPHSFEITNQVAARSDHCLAVEVSCPRPADTAHKRTLTGAYQDSDSIDRSLNPGGLWAPVRVETTGPVRIAHHRIVCTDADTTRASVAMRLVLDAADECDVVVRSRVGDHAHRVSRHLAAGENRIEWTVQVPDPELWWPRALGAQPLHEVEIDVLIDTDTRGLDTDTGGPDTDTGGPGSGDPADGDPEGPTSDSVRARIGLRSVELRDWITHVNGERLFLKGTNLGPTGAWPAEVTAEQVRRDLDLVVDAGLDLVRLHGHIAHPALYDAADELGLLLWQDLPLQWGYHRSVRRQAAAQAREAVDLLGHHPSVMLWCGHSDATATPIRAHDLTTPTRRRAAALRFLRDQELPTYNRTVLDRTVARALRRNDPSRPVIAHSGALPTLPRLDGTASHLYLGWYVGEDRQLPSLLAALPRLARFVGEFGAQSVPEDAPFIDADAWPDLDWDHLERHHCLQRSAFERYVPPGDYRDAASWAAATRRYQAEVIRYGVETLRRLKYRPTGGFAQFDFADAAPGVTWSVLSADRHPKDAYWALVEACRPVIVVAERPPDHCHPGDQIALDVHVVSDLRRPVIGARTTATVTGADGRTETAGWTGTVDADTVAFVGTLFLEAPDVAGPLTIDLELRADDVVATNRYTTAVVVH